MILPCSIVRALHAVFRVTDWVIEIISCLDGPSALCLVVIWSMIAIAFTAFDWGWWSLAGPLVVIAVFVAIYWACRGIGAAYVALRHWTETRYLECVRQRERTKP